MKSDLPLSATCIPDVLDDAGLNASEFRVYCHLRRRSRRGDTCYPAVQSIAAVCGFNRKTVISALSSLEKKGLIQRRPSTGKPTIYYLQPGPFNGLPPSPPGGPAHQTGQPVSVTPPGPFNGPTPGPPDGLRKDEDDKERMEREKEGAKRSNSEKIDEIASKLLSAGNFRTEWQHVPEEPRNAFLSAVPLLMNTGVLDLVCRHLPMWMHARETSPGRFSPVTFFEVARNITNIHEYASKREESPGAAFVPVPRNGKSTAADRDRQKTGLNQEIELPRL